MYFALHKMVTVFKMHGLSLLINLLVILSINVSDAAADCGSSTCSATQQCSTIKHCSDVKTKVCTVRDNCTDASATCDPKCVCKDGYTGDTCTDPLCANCDGTHASCKKTCLKDNNKGCSDDDDCEGADTCGGPGVCVCSDGYGGTGCTDAPSNKNGGATKKYSMVLLGFQLILTGPFLFLCA